ncbi:hypothetical protein GCM10010345_23600 [Streptomyces canarius]|uniref:DUF4158 domain-containing protein n=1 Tax=Streptomyces canarius TaxID=285453 RepID=A0ABQ3CIB9_9ACTN|nr:hypothetical protein GCM10010345_23600 [Streptomyces canarius]
MERQGLRLTTPIRTCADLLRCGPRDSAIVAVDSALTHRRVELVRRAPLVRKDEIAAMLGKTSQGSVRALNWLRLTDPLAGSPAKTVARLRMYDAELHPESQAELRTPDGARRFVDFLFRAAGLAVEIEGYAYHGTPQPPPLQRRGRLPAACVHGRGDQGHAGFPDRRSQVTVGPLASRPVSGLGGANAPRQHAGPVQRVEGWGGGSGSASRARRVDRRLRLSPRTPWGASPCPVRG